MNELISVIVPVYNQEKYLVRCLDSLIQQTYHCLEIILIDDGSTDNSNSIMQKYAKDDNRIQIVSKANGGLSDARNSGLDIASGKYVTFVDSDDWVDIEYIEKMYQTLKKYSADIVVVNPVKVWNTSKVNRNISKYSKIFEYNSSQAIADMWYQRNIGNYACGKLYSIELFRGIRYPVGRLYEDLATTYKLFWQAHRIVYFTEKLYYYFQHTGSIMSRPFDKRNLDRIYVSKDLLDWAYGQDDELIKAAETRFFVSNLQVLREIPVDEEYSEELAILKGNITQYRNSVWKNRKAKISVRCMAALSILDIGLLKKLGDIYKMIFK